MAGVHEEARAAMSTNAAWSCRVSAPSQVRAKGPALLRFALTHRGIAAFDVLTWGTPFEAMWTAPYVHVTRDGVALAYRGPMIKRGMPTKDEYLRWAAHRTRRASADLAQVFDLAQPGLYRVTTTLHLHDVKRAGTAIDPGGARHAVTVVCPEVEFTVR